MWRGVLGTLSLWAVGAVALRATVIAPQACPAVSSEAAIAGARAAAAWAGHVQLADGSYLYEYNAEDDHDLGGYNVVRHAGVTMAVFQYAATTTRSSKRTASLRFKASPNSRTSPLPLLFSMVRFFRDIFGV